MPTPFDFTRLRALKGRRVSCWVDGRLVRGKAGVVSNGRLLVTLEDGRTVRVEDATEIPKSPVRRRAALEVR